MAPFSDLLLQELCELEIALHQPDVRADPRRLDALLHDDFMEFGRSGRRYDKVGIMRDLSAERPSGKIRTKDFALAQIAPDVALLTYQSAHEAADGALSRYTRRASLWQRNADGWQIRFHQGTPVDIMD
jgi:hypothetical protein